jgi:hypothetical protein
MAGHESPAWLLAPHALDLSREADAVVESPSGQRFRGSALERPIIDLNERGFYEVRAATTAIGAGRPIAVNVDLAESDLSHFDPAELVAALTARAQRGGSSAAGTALSGTAQDLERRQSLWWYLLVAAALVLTAETMFANRMSRAAIQRRTSGAA